MQCFFPKEMKEYIRTMTCSVLLDLILILKAPFTTKDVGFVLAICWIVLEASLTLKCHQYFTTDHIAIFIFVLKAYTSEFVFWELSADMGQSFQEYSWIQENAEFCR